MSKILNFISFLRKNIHQTLFLAVLVTALVLTWFFFQSKKTFPERTHLVLQEEFQRVVKERLLKKNPLAENIQFQELWTETTGQSKQIRTVFSYTFNDAPSEGEKSIQVTVRGSALIDQQSAEKDMEKWVIGSFEVDQTELNFENEAIVIKPERNSDVRRKPDQILEELPDQGKLFFDNVKKSFSSQKQDSLFA